MLLLLLLAAVSTGGSVEAFQLNLGAPLRHFRHHFQRPSPVLYVLSDYRSLDRRTDHDDDEDEDDDYFLQTEDFSMYHHDHHHQIFRYKNKETTSGAPKPDGDASGWDLPIGRHYLSIENVIDDERPYDGISYMVDPYWTSSLFEDEQEISVADSAFKRNHYLEMGQAVAGNYQQLLESVRHIPSRVGSAWHDHLRATRRLQRNVQRKQQAPPQPATATTEKAENNKGLPEAILSFLFKNRNSPLVSATPEWKRLEQHVEALDQLHLRDLLQDAARCQALYATTDDDSVYLDYSRQRVTSETMQLLLALAERQDLRGRIAAMMGGEKINFTEQRSVLHTALRAPWTQEIIVDNENVVQQVHEVLDQVQSFTDRVRSGAIRGYTGKRLRNIVSVGIGGSYLGPEFLHECLKTEPEGIHAALGYSLRFLSNVDPVDVERTCADLDPEETLVVIVSKTFTTAETMLNARTMRQWLWDFMGNDPAVVQHHMVACASVSATPKVAEFGIDVNTGLFRFWDWVGGRYSVCSAAGAVPISLLYGYDLFAKFLAGARSMDEHFACTPLEHNIPVIMGLLGVWNKSFLKYSSRTTLPYAEALLKLPAHIQQLDSKCESSVVGLVVIVYCLFLTCNCSRA
jgi:glucose-6-phosphate isomerase